MGGEWKRKCVSELPLHKSPPVYGYTGFYPKKKKSLRSDFVGVYTRSGRSINRRAIRVREGDRSRTAPPGIPDEFPDGPAFRLLFYDVDGDNAKYKIDRAGPTGHGVTLA